MTVTDRATDGLVNFHQQELSWREVEAPIATTVQTATVTVPVDYSQPDGRVVELAIARHGAADPAHRLGVLLVAPDDPGSRGVPLMWQLLPSLPAEVVERHDVVSFDHRFSGESAPFSIGLSMEEILWVFHASPDFETECRFQEQIAQKAAAGALETLPHLTSLNIARDIDVIREALNEDKISFLGYSYGSYLGAVYTQLFGQHASRVVLDSVISPDWVWRGLFRAIAASTEMGLTKWAAWAATQDGELRLGDSPEAVRRRVDGLLAAASREPVVIPPAATMDAALLRVVMIALLRTDQTHGVLGDLLRAAVHQEQVSAATANLLGALFSAPRDESTAAAQLAILCGDHWWPRSREVYRADARRDGERYPFLGRALSGIKPGAFWPIAPREPAATIGRDNPAESVLLVQSDGDVLTPSHGARRLRALLPHNSRLISVADSMQHRVFPFYRNSEVNDLVATYLVDGALPRSDQVCANTGAKQPQPEG